jgi:hypothetical protein
VAIGCSPRSCGGRSLGAGSRPAPPPDRRGRYLRFPLSARRAGAARRADCELER